MDCAGTHVVSMIKGSVRETFDYIDKDKSGSIDASELGALLSEMSHGKEVRVRLTTDTHHSPPTTHHSPLTTHHPPPTTHHLLEGGRLGANPDPNPNPNQAIASGRTLTLTLTLTRRSPRGSRRSRSTRT